MMSSCPVLKRKALVSKALAVSLVAAAVAFLLVSCSGDGDGAKSPAEDSDAGKAPAAAETAGARSVSDVTFVTLYGEEKKISDYGRKILLVNYIETWNVDSKKLVPIMNEIQRKFHVNVTVLGIVTDKKGGVSAARSFVNANDARFEVLLPGGNPGLFGRAGRLPTTHVVTREDELFYKWEGLHTQKQYEEFILGMYRRRM
jgi:hypothetical protein